MMHTTQQMKTSYLRPNTFLSDLDFLFIKCITFFQHFSNQQNPPVDFVELVHVIQNQQKVSGFFFKKNHVLCVFLLVLEDLFLKRPYLIQTWKE